jgi:hypothetical protein
MDGIELPLGPRHLGVSFGASKMISKPMVRLTQTMHPSSTDNNTVFKRTEMKFHKNHITYEFHGVCPKWFLGLWYVQRKSFIHLASRLALYPNGLNPASTWASSPWTTIAGIQNDSEPMVCLAQTVHLSCTNTNTNTISNWTKMIFHTTHLVVTLSVSKMISELVVHSALSVCLSCIKISTISKRTKSRFHLSLVT